MRQILVGFFLVLTSFTASLAAGVTRTDAGVCPSIGDHQEHMRQILGGNYAHELPSRCVIFDSEVSVTGPFERKTAKYGEGDTEFVQIGISDGRRMWTLSSWVIFHKPKAPGAYYAQSNANVRATPSISGAVITKLSRGARVEVKADPSPVSADGYTWVSVQTPDDRAGWTAQSLLGATAPASKRLTKSTLPDRIKSTLSSKTSIKSITFRGSTLVIALGKPSFDQEEIYPIFKDACKYVAMCDCSVREIAVTNQFGGYGYVYERPDRCSSLQGKSGRQLEIAIVSHTHMM